MVWVVYVAGACYETNQPWAKAGYGVWFSENKTGGLNCSGTVSGRQTLLEAELHAAIQAIKIAIREGFDRLEIQTDSNQLLNGVRTLDDRLMRNNWKTSNGVDLAEWTSKEKWIELQNVISQYPGGSSWRISWRFGGYHTGQNEANKLAFEAAKRGYHVLQSYNF